MTLSKKTETLYQQNKKKSVWIVLN